MIIKNILVNRRIMGIKSKELTEKIVYWLQEKKAEDIKVIDVKEQAEYTDFIILCSGNSGLHMKAIADNVVLQAKNENIPLFSKEGTGNDWWILLDFVDVIVHIFSYKSREYYKLEEIFQKTKEFKTSQ